MSYRPITDMWILARAKLKDGKKYYGAYPGGFPERARALLGVNLYEDAVLHVCGGMAKHYPYKGGFCINDETLDLDPATEPDFLQDARDPLPDDFDAYLIDPPYTPEDADKYAPGSDMYPKPNVLLKNALESLRPGGRVGILHYIIPKPPKDIETKYIAQVGVMVGFNNRIRSYSVFERLS